MLPKLRLVLSTAMVALLLGVAAVNLLSGPRNAGIFAIGLRSAQGSPIERSLPEPPDVKQFAALAASRRAEELNRLLALEAAPRTEDAVRPVDDAPSGQSEDAPAGPASVEGAAATATGDSADPDSPR